MASCPECQVELDVVRVYVSALVPQALRDELHAEARRLNLSLSQLIIAKLAEPAKAKHICRTCAGRTKRRQREFGEHRPPAA